MDPTFARYSIVMAIGLNGYNNLSFDTIEQAVFVEAISAVLGGSEATRVEVITVTTSHRTRHKRGEKPPITLPCPQARNPTPALAGEVLSLSLPRAGYTAASKAVFRGGGRRGVMLSCTGARGLHLTSLLILVSLLIPTIGATSPRIHPAQAAHFTGTPSGQASHPQQRRHCNIPTEYDNLNTALTNHLNPNGSLIIFPQNFLSSYVPPEYTPSREQRLSPPSPSAHLRAHATNHHFCILTKYYNLNTTLANHLNPNGSLLIFPQNFLSSYVPPEYTPSRE